MLQTIFLKERIISPYSPNSYFVLAYIIPTASLVLRARLFVLGLYQEFNFGLVKSILFLLKLRAHLLVLRLHQKIIFSRDSASSKIYICTRASDSLTRF